MKLDRLRELISSKGMYVSGYPHWDGPERTTTISPLYGAVAEEVRELVFTLNYVGSLDMYNSQYDRKTFLLP